MTRFLLTLLLSACIVQLAVAQPCDNPRYQQRVFPQSFKTSNIVFGNAPSLPTTVYLGESVTQNVNLTMDVYQPFGDTLQKRPLVILSFGGAFLIGSKDDEDIQSVSDSLARRGYVTACINYRLGMNIADAVSAERAIYRALQDFSAAVRYFKEFADVYGVDTNYIYVGGVSAGGFAALHMALVEESDRPASTFAAGGLNPRPDLGCKDCSGNNYPHSSNVRGVINYWGAIGDVNWIKPNTAKPLVSFHGDQDLIVPYNTGFPFTALAQLPQVSGSGAIKQRYDQLGAYNKHYKIAGEGHNIWGLMVMNRFTPGPNQYYMPIYAGTADFLWEQSRPETPSIQGLDTVCPNTVAIYTINNRVGERYCWHVTGGQITRNLGNSIEVYWGNSPGTVQVKTTNHLDAESLADTVAVTVRASSVAAIETPNGTIVCAGDSLPLSSLFSAAQYQWLPAAFYTDDAVPNAMLNPLISGLYYLQVTDTNGCIAKDSVYITVEPAPAQPSITQVGDTLIALAGLGNLYWYDESGVVMGSGDLFKPTQNGNYTVEEVLNNGCRKRSAPLTFTATGMGNAIFAQVQLFPNPTDGLITILWAGQGMMTITDVAGKAVGNYSISGNTQLDLSGLRGGIYLYYIEADGQRQQGRLVKY